MSFQLQKVSWTTVFRQFIKLKHVQCMQVFLSFYDVAPILVLTEHCMEFDWFMVWIYFILVLLCNAKPILIVQLLHRLMFTHISIRMNICNMILPFLFFAIFVI